MSKRRFFLPGDIENSGRTSSLPVICEKIRYYREKRGIEQKEIAEKLGITGNSVSNWETGRSRPDVNLLPAICSVLNITFYELFDLDDPESYITTEQKELMEKYSSLSKGHQYAVDNLIESLLTIENKDNCPEIKVLLYFRRSLAAGIGDPTEFEEDAEQVYVYSTSETKRADSIFRINGNSMEPVFSDGQDVLVQRISSDKTLKPGEIGAFIIGNETYIKRYEKDGLYSFNPDYPVMHFYNEESVYLIGRVIGTLKPDDYVNESDIKKYKIQKN